MTLVEPIGTVIDLEMAVREDAPQVPWLRAPHNAGYRWLLPAALQFSGRHTPRTPNAYLDCTKHAIPSAKPADLR